MVMTDPIADFLTRVRNANMVKHESLEVPEIGRASCRERV